MHLDAVIADKPTKTTVVWIRSVSINHVSVISLQMHIGNIKTNDLQQIKQYVIKTLTIMNSCHQNKRSLLHLCVFTVNYT